MQKSAPSAVFELRPSVLLLRALWFFHGIAALAAAANALPVSVRIALGAAVCLSLVKCIVKVRVPWLRSLQMKSDADWRLTLRDGREVSGRLLGCSRVTRCFVLLHFQIDGGEQSVLILPDSLAQEAYRMLRLTLRIGAIATPPAFTP